MIQVKCLHCSHQVTVPTIVFEYFVCPKCYRSHQHKGGGYLADEADSVSNFESHIPIGKSVSLDNVTYWVTNVILKKSPDNEYWKEYELVSDKRQYKYLTEECGNWTLSEKIELDDNFKGVEVKYDDKTFALFEKGNCQDYSGVGFFDFKIGKNYITYKDFIHPPYLLSQEVEEGEKTIYYGKHISGKEVEKLFDLTVMPFKSKIGIVQPFFYDFRKSLLVFCYAALVVLVSHIIFYQTAGNKKIYSKIIDLNNQNGKEITTDVFELKGPIAPLNIYIDTDVDNSWLATDFTLINETTNETAYFSKDVEYYHGYEGGENWSEGSSIDEFNICGVSSGKYRIAFTPNKDATDIQNNRMRMDVYWDKGDNWNFIVVLGAFIVLAIILYYIKNNFEQRRWYDSDYSPFSKEQD